MSIQDLTLTIRGLCPIIFEGNPQKAMIGVISEVNHKPHLTIDGEIKDSQLKGTSTLEVIRRVPSQFTNEIRRFSKEVKEDEIPPNGIGEFGFIECSVNVQNQLYNRANLKIKTELLKFRLTLNDGQFLVSKLFIEPEEEAPKEIFFFPEGEPVEDDKMAVHHCYMPDEITVRIQLDTNDVAVVTFDNGETLTLDATRPHEIILSNECPDRPEGGEDDFSFQYTIYDLEGRKRIRPRLTSGGDGMTLCSPGYNCKPPSLCS